MRKHKKLESYLSWLKKSGEDELSAEWLLGEKKGSPSTVCFLAQQIAEKHLKALLDFHNKTIKKTHDLVVLESFVKEIVPKIDEFHENFKLLNSFYIETRYPGDLVFTWELAKEGFKAASKVKKFILSHFENEPNGD